MLVNLDVAKSSSYSETVPSDSTERTYYIKAEQIEWDYSPNGFQHGCFAQNLKEDSALWLQTGDYSIGSKRQKLRFVEYTDDSFTNQKSQPSYHGILGPLIAAEVGDTVKVVLKNDIPIDGENVNFALGGGFVELNGTDTNKVITPGETYTYRWMVPAEVSDC
ncbi:Cupredoxin [Dunaliella salina]|uniref:Cupredoxin n=1 Tax=Dunaliella salina TaxID=3046 RepID=A0ABQ7FS49_DUNSA|nr:Cupredoxin [Dunaliella salina]|eukprot:KAF5825367.1 Cupredoxin [Dunaliella salina]